MVTPDRLIAENVDPVLSARSRVIIIILAVILLWLQA